MKRKIIFAVASILLILIDQLTKFWIEANLQGKPNIVWIKNVFELEYLRNDGAAFSSFSGQQVFLLILTSIILIIVIFEFIRTPDSKRYNWLLFGFTLLISGAIGNMIDRISKQYVVDFFYFVPINFPRFNVADCYITVSAFLLAILVIFVYKDEETAFLIPFKKK